MPGTVVTFYSYKGGVGSTFALANTAVVLARWGYRTLCVDWDLDAPGLDFDLLPRTAERPAAGLVDLIDAHAAGAAPDPLQHVVRVDRPEVHGRLDMLAAGGPDRARYVRQVQELDWDRLYRDHDLGGFLERCSRRRPTKRARSRMR